MAKSQLLENKRSYNAIWRKNNSDYYREYLRKYYHRPVFNIRKRTNNRVKNLIDEQRSVYMKAYRKEYIKTVKWKAIIANSRHRNRMAKKETDIDTKYLLDLWDRTKVCDVCSSELGVDRSLDHIVPLIIGGAHVKTNVRYIHKVCNSRRPKDGSDLPQHIYAR